MLWERESLHFACWLEKQWTLSQRIISQAVVGLGDIKFLPTGWNFTSFIFGYKIYKLYIFIVIKKKKKKKKKIKYLKKKKKKKKL